MLALLASLRGAQRRNPSLPSLCGAMDCFASLAMTAVRVVVVIAMTVRHSGGEVGPRRPGQASVASVDPGPITTGRGCLARWQHQLGTTTIFRGYGSRLSPGRHRNFRTRLCVSLQLGHVMTFYSVRLNSPINVAFASVLKCR